jgi:hypothetical protein
VIEQRGQQRRFDRHPGVPPIRASEVSEVAEVAEVAATARTCRPRRVIHVAHKDIDSRSARNNTYVGTSLARRPDGAS